MAQTAAKYAGTVADDSSAGTTAWTNPTNAQGSNNSTVASAASAAGGVFTRRLKATNFGFTTSDIPTGSTINGFIIRVRVRGGTNNRAYMNELFVVKGGTTQTSGTNLGEGSGTTFSNSLTNRSYGSASQLFGVSWTSADVRDSGFGLSIQVGRNNTTTAECAWFEVVVDYTAPVTHTTTGTLTGPGSTVAGSANHIGIHPSSGALTGQGAAVVGSANRTKIHAASGALTGQGAEIAGSATHIGMHGTTGALVGPGAAVVGSAAHTGGSTPVTLVQLEPIEDDTYLSGGDLTLVSENDSVYAAARSTDGHASGKWYFEVSIDCVDLSFAIGVCTSGWDNTTYLGEDSDSAGFWPYWAGFDDYYISYYDGPTYQENLSFEFPYPGGVLGVAVDVDAGKMWPRGAGGFDGDPVAGTGGYAYTPSGTIYAALHTYYGVDHQLTANFGASAFEYSVPTGFTAWNGGGGGPVTHTTTGALTGQGSTVAGTAAHKTLHPTSGALTGPGSTIEGSANRTRAHPTSGTLTGQGSAVTGAAAHPHTTSGALTGQGAEIAGTANRTRVHPTSGALTGQGSTVSGTAAHNRPHATTGVLEGQGATIEGAAERTDPASSTHETTGVLAGQGAEIAGGADHRTLHDTAGAIVGAGSLVLGEAAFIRAPVTHETTGELVGQGAVVTCAANRREPSRGQSAWRPHSPPPDRLAVQTATRTQPSQGGRRSIQLGVRLSSTQTRKR